MSTILVVDDDQEMGRLLRTLFELEGHKVVVTRYYGEVLPAIRRVFPDAIVLDVRVQSKETIDLVREMRQEKRLARIPVLMTSGLDRSRECLQAGADRFVLKPFLPDELVEIVASLLR